MNNQKVKTSALNRYRAMRRDLMEGVFTCMIEARKHHELTGKEVKRWAKHEARFERISEREALMTCLVRLD